MTTSIAFATAVAACMTTAAVTDLHSRRIPNWLTVPMAACGLTFHALAPVGFGLGSSLLGLLVGFSLLLVPYVVGGGGAGDVKLLAALGAWLGWKLLLVAFVMSILLSAVIAVVMLAVNAVGQLFGWRGRNVAEAEPTFVTDELDNESVCGSRQPRRSLPFAVPAAVSTTVLLAWLVSNGRL